ncbi:thioredoxin-like protein [Dentipellis sp. KUC8613]|nr:thioredoxin-like protein [Dentipellis sp. KUC8613]
MNVLRAARTGSTRQLTHGHAAPRRLKHYLNADRATFDKLTSAAHTADRVVLVDFYAEWCNPCKILSPILEKLAADESTKSGTGRAVDLVTIDTDAEVGLAAQFDVRSIPTVYAFKDGKPVEHFVGAMNEAGVRRFLEHL